MHFKKISIHRKKEYSVMKEKQPSVPKGMVTRCKKCGATLFTQDVKEHHFSCLKCGGYFRVNARQRIAMIVDEDSFKECEEGLVTNNPLGQTEYLQKIKNAQEKTGLNEAVITGFASIKGTSVALAVMDGRFMMASMGEVVGEKITRLIEEATEKKLPLIIFCCSGGARMQEGIISLMQMAKTAAALKRFKSAGNLYLSVLTDPTSGGVTASFAMLGDVIIAEPKALICFAGPRVIEQTIGEKLPEGFQRAEFLLEHGFIDAVVRREELRDTMGKILKLHAGNVSQTQQCQIEQGNGYLSKEKQRKHFIKSALESKRKKDAMSAWDRVTASRKKDRPVGDDYIRNLFPDFIEFHGDRYAGDDASIMGGIASFQGNPVTVIAQVKGHDTKENIIRNFGMPSPEGYRKSIRLMKQAEKFQRPIICFVDTPGAYPGMEAEEHGQGEAIAHCICEMSALKVPVVSIFIGEGGSGGALAMAVSNEIWMLSNSVYSILSPEGYASILWKDGSRAEEAARAMKMTAEELYVMDVIEKVFEEPDIYTNETMFPMIETIRMELGNYLREISGMTGEELAQRRYERFRNF